MNLNNIVSGKRVCLTGSSQSIERNPAGFIDSFDIVVRINQSWISHPELRENIGHKMDIVYIPGKDGWEMAGLFGKINKDNFDINKIQYIKHELEDPATIELLDCLNIDHDNDLELKIWRFQNHIGMEKRPSCGLFAAWDLLKTDLIQLYITGISFYHEVYKQGHIWTHMGDETEVNRTNPHHDSIADEEYFCSTLYPQQSDRILLDPTLQAIYRGHC